MPDSLDDFLRRHSAKRPVNLEHLSRYTVQNDRWDRQTFDRLLEQQPEVGAARQKLADNIAGDLAYDEAADLIWLMLNYNPQLLDDKEIRPSRLINARVNAEASGLSSLEKVRRFTTGDPIAAAQAFEQIEPEVETLYDRLKDRMEEADRYQQALQEALQAKEEQQTAEELLQQWLDDHPEPEEEDDKEPSEPEEGEGEESEEGQPQPDENGEEEKEDDAGENQEGEGDGKPDEKAQLEQNVKDATGRAQQAGEKAADALQSLQSGLNGQAPDIRQAMEEALEKANISLEVIENMASSWGSDPGELRRLPAKKRLELAKKLNTPKFQRISELIGPMERLADAEQKRRIVNTPEEIVDLTVGDDIPRLIPPEFAKLMMPETKMLFYKDLVERSLVQYEMKGEEKLARGGIIYCHDGSLSMAGEREIWAKAVGLALLHVARKQERSFYGIQFGTASEIRIDAFPDTSKLTPDDVIRFAEFFFNGGTEFMPPLRAALDILKKQYVEFGAVQADIVFATDGQSYITDEFMHELKDTQQKLDFRVYGIAIGAGGINEIQAEPLSTLCDGKVATIKSLLNARDMSEVFRGI